MTQASDSVVHEPNKISVTAQSPGPRSKALVSESSRPIVEDLSTLALSGPSGVIFSATSGQLRSNLVVLAAGENISAHVNHEVDVLIIGVSGTGTLLIDGQSITVGTDVLALVPRGCERSITAGSRLIYHSIHSASAGDPPAERVS